jgi:hypothetical protein
MSKFHLKLKIQGFELEVVGTREDVPVLREALTQQVAGMLPPAMEMADAEVRPNRAPLSGATTSPTPDHTKRGRRHLSRPQAKGTENESPIEWRHDTAKYGSPMQAWSNAEKAMWLLYVAGNEANAAEMSNRQIITTFKKQFRSAGPILGKNLTRDLSRYKVAQNSTAPLVSDDTTKTPPVWYLTDAGKKHAQKLVAQALGHPATAA